MTKACVVLTTPSWSDYLQSLLRHANELCSETSPSFRPLSSEVVLMVETTDLIMVSVRLRGKKKKNRCGKELGMMANDAIETAP